jgi:sensor c-di-GMP phosphodiesterase-like protein
MTSRTLAENSQMNVKAVATQSLTEDLRHALVRNELTLVYQPIVNVKTGAITGAEALLRWTHPTRGSVSPDVFIPVAEDSSMEWGAKMRYPLD